jgi:RNA polymerase sigma-70 factor (ECF subfamily)
MPGRFRPYHSREVMGHSERPPQTGPGQDETFLLARARQGDLAAFEEVVRRYQRRVYGVALRIVRAHDLADDVAQEAFVRAWQALERFDVGRPFGPWVCRIAANLAVNHVRSPRSREEALPEGHAETPSADPGPLGAVLDAEARWVLDAAVAALSPEQRAVFVLRAVEEMSYEEIARALDISPGTVMSRLFRARERLAKALAPYLGEAVARPKAGGA